MGGELGSFQGTMGAGPKAAPNWPVPIGEPPQVYGEGLAGSAPLLQLTLAVGCGHPAASKAGCS